MPPGHLSPPAPRPDVRNKSSQETLPDGGCVVRFMNGDLKRVEGKTGIVVYTYAAAQTVHTMYPSGLEVFQFPNGQVWLLYVGVVSVLYGMCGGEVLQITTSILD